MAGAYGKFSINAAGAWTYVANSAHDEFAAGSVHTDQFTVSSADGATTVTINIAGTNSAAVLSSDTRNLTEGNTAADISTSGKLTISDVDSPATFVAQANVALRAFLDQQHRGLDVSGQFRPQGVCRGNKHRTYSPSRALMERPVL